MEHSPWIWTSQSASPVPFWSITREPVSPLHEAGTTDVKDTEPGHWLGDALQAQEMHPRHMFSQRSLSVGKSRARKAEEATAEALTIPVLHWEEAEASTVLPKCSTQLWWQFPFVIKHSTALSTDLALCPCTGTSPALTHTADHGSFPPACSSITRYRESDPILNYISNNIQLILNCVTNTQCAYSKTAMYHVPKVLAAIFNVFIFPSRISSFILK